MTEHVILGAFVGCLLGGLLPWINSEVIVGGAALALAVEQAAWLAVAAAAGQMIAKTGVYCLARWAPGRLPRRMRAALERADVLRRSRRATTLTVLASSCVSLPPFYLVTLAAGVVRVPLLVFAGAGLTGTFLRYAVLIAGATAAKSGIL